MKVTLIASTEFHALPLSVRNTSFGRYIEDSEFAWHDEDLLNEADTLAHFSGRACYQSWDMPNPETDTNDTYLANIIKQQHFSVLEHSSATFYLEGISRNLTHELIRHRHLSYSELSQRFVDMENSNIVVPPAIDLLELFTGAGELGKVHREAVIAYDKLVKALDAVGVKGKKAREAARAVIPGGAETKIVVTGNMRAWRDMLHKRYSVHADAEIRELATEILKQLREIAPGSFQDFPEEPFK